MCSVIFEVCILFSKVFFEIILVFNTQNRNLMISS